MRVKSRLMELCGCLLLAALMSSSFSMPHRSVAAPLMQSSYICGHCEGDTLRTGWGSAYIVDVFVTCANERYRWESFCGADVCSGTCRIYDPVLEPTDQLLEGGRVTQLITGFSRAESIADCSQCNSAPQPGEPPTIDFRVDHNTIQRGECTTLRWDVENVNEIYLDGQGVIGHDTRPVCPETTTTYTLRVVINSGDQVRTVSVQVLEPPPPSPTVAPPPPPTDTPRPPSTSTVPPALPPTHTPLPSSPLLAVTGLEIEPVPAKVLEMVRLRIAIQNQGAPLNQAFWDYSGQVILEGADGNALESHSFARGDSSFLSPVTEGSRVNFEKWSLIVKVRLATAITNGKVKIIIQPSAPLPPLGAEARITVNPGLSGLTCSSVILNKLAVALPEIPKDELDALSAELQAWGCQDNDLGCQARPLVKALVKILIRWFSDARNIPVAKITLAIWGVFDQGALETCRDPVGWMWQLVREFNREGVPISVYSVHSPALLLVTNSAGQRTGFVTEDDVVTEISGSWALEWEGDRYAILPADSGVTVSLLGTGPGTAAVSLIDGQWGREFLYEGVPVTDGSQAWIRPSDQEAALALDYNGDGSIDETRVPRLIEVLHPEVATRDSSRLAATLGMLILFVIVLSAVLLMVLVRASVARRPTLVSREGVVAYGPPPQQTNRPTRVGRPALAVAPGNQPVAGSDSWPPSSPATPADQRPSALGMARSAEPGIAPRRGTRAVNHLREHRAVLVERARPERRYELAGTMTVGRSRGNHIVLEHPSVSRQHAWLEMRGTECWVCDAGSTNGTYVNNYRVRDPQRLRYGDVVRFGGAQFVFETF